MNTNPIFKQQTTGFSQEYLTNEIIMWGHNKGIIKFSTSDAQASRPWKKWKNCGHTQRS